MAERGRPSEYNAKYHIPWVKSLARRGLTVKEIAKEIGVAKSTLCKWVAENEDLSDALNDGRTIADSVIESSLYERATGKTVTIKRTVISSSGNMGEQKPVKVEIIEKEIPPDTTACIYWLKNRDPKHWRDKMDISLENDHDMEKMSKEIQKILRKSKIK